MPKGNHKKCSPGRDSFPSGQAKPLPKGNFFETCGSYQLIQGEAASPEQDITMQCLCTDGVKSRVQTQLDLSKFAPSPRVGGEGNLLDDSTGFLEAVDGHLLCYGYRSARF